MPASADVFRRAPALGAALAVVAAGLVAAYGGEAAGLAALGAGVAAAGAAAGPGGLPTGSARAWLLVAGLVGARLVAETGAAQRDARAWAALAAGAEPLAVRGTLRVDAVRATGPARWSVRGTLEGCPAPCADADARWSWGGEEPPRPGDRVAVMGTLHAEPPRAAPGARFPPGGLGPGARRGRLEGAPPGAVASARVPILTAAEEHLRARIAVRFGGLAPLFVALLLGDRGALDPALADAFATTGTLHLLAVSGLHVGFLAGLLAFGLRLARAGPATRAAAATALLAGYTALVGARPSAVRATVMASLALWAWASERRVDRWQPWGAAAVGVLAWRPGDLFDLGFGLSFGSVAGLLVFVDPIERRLATTAPVADRAAGRPTVLARGTALLGTGLAATTAATLATLPLQAAAFGWLAPAGLVLNPFVLPLAAIGLPLAWIALAADAAGLGFVAGPLAHAAGLALALVEAGVALVGARADPWVPGATGWLVAAGLAALVGVAVARRTPGPALGAGALALALVLAAAPPRPRVLEIVWLDVGQGDAIVLHFPNGAAWLVDAGPADPFGDAGRRVVLPYLRRRGIDRIARLVTTHPDLDHVGGAASVVRGARVARWGSAGPVDDGPAWLALVAASGPRPERLGSATRLREGAVTVDVLHPPPGWVARDPYAARVSANEASVVLLVGHGPCRALLTGDLGRPGEAELVRSLGDSLRADLLHAGHHGSRHSSTRALLNSVRPRDVVVSAGRGNRHGHPHAEALARWTEAGAKVWRTDRSGTITARCSALGWRLSTSGSYLR